MFARPRTNFFSKDKTTDFVIRGLTGELNTRDSDFDIQDNQLSGGQNMISASATTLKKRDGVNLYGSFLGTGIGLDGGWSFVGQNGTQEEICVWNGSLYRLVGSTWTAVTGVTLTAGLPCSGVYFADTNKFYIVNGTDYVVKYQAGSASGDQSDTNFPKGKYICSFQGRLIVGCITGYPNQFDYSAAGLDTFNTGVDFVVLPGEFNIAITGVYNFNSVAVLISTRRRLYRLQNFTFDGTRSWVENLYELPANFGAIYERTFAIVNGNGYFLGQDMSNVAAIYMTDGYNAYNISYSKILVTTQSLNPARLQYACAITDSVFYRLYVAENTQTTNNLGIIYDTGKSIFLTPERKWVNGIDDYACLWSSEISGVWQIYAGSAVTGQVYKIHGNAGLYDEFPEEQYNKTAASSQAVNLAVDANPSKRVSQGFKMSNYNITNLAVPIIRIGIYVKKNAGTNTDLVVRVETDNAGQPSGTLADASATATIAAGSIGSGYSWIMSTFSFTLAGNTLYWIVVKHAVEDTGNSQYYLLGNTSGTYGNGHVDTYTTGYITAGAGTTAVNGSWALGGTNEGKAYYTHGIYYLYYATNPAGYGAWRISQSLQPNGTPLNTSLYYNLTDDNPAVGSWVTFNGNVPAPTVTYTSWTTGTTTTNLVFIVYARAPIDAYADTKAFLVNKGREFVMKKYQTIFSNMSTSPVTMLIGFSDTKLNTFASDTLTLTTDSGGIYGTTAELGSNKLYGTTAEGGDNTIFGVEEVKNYTFKNVSSFTGRILKVRIRNNQYGQQFEFNQLNAIVTPRMRDF